MANTHRATRLPGRWDMWSLPALAVRLSPPPASTPPTNAPADDPADFTLYGSNDGVTWSLIDYTPLALPMARNASSGTINSNNQVLQEIDFPNTNGYYQYAVYFTNVVGGGAADMGLEFAEVQLLGVPAAPLPVATLVNRWSFNGNLLDSSGNDNNGTLTGAGPYGYVPGVFGEQGLYFSTNNVINTTAAVGLPAAGTASWSMNLWLYLTNQPNASSLPSPGGRTMGGRQAPTGDLPPRRGKQHGHLFAWLRSGPRYPC